MKLLRRDEKRTYVPGLHDMYALEALFFYHRFASSRTVWRKDSWGRDITFLKVLVVREEFLVCAFMIALIGVFGSGWAFGGNAGSVSIGLAIYICVCICL